MKPETDINYTKIERAITFMRDNFKSQPVMEEVAKIAGISPFHFQRVFFDWAGTTPKRFLQLTSLDFAKKLLSQKESIETASIETGFSSSSRLHDLFVKVEGMSPGDYKNGGAGLTIEFSFAATPFGNTIIASTTKGICYLAFYDEGADALAGLRQMFPAARLLENSNVNHTNALKIFGMNWDDMHRIKLHLKASTFQLRVWQALLQIPQGNIQSYAHIAALSGHAGASRAVGTAIGKNAVAFLIPCHRVIQSNGNFGQYMWGKNRKAAILGWEFSKKMEVTDECKVQIP